MRRRPLSGRRLATLLRGSLALALRKLLLHCHRYAERPVLHLGN